MSGFELFDALNDTKKYIFLMTRCETSVNSLFGTMLHLFLLNHLLSIKNPIKPSSEEML